MFLVCTREFICLCIFLCTYVCMWHTPIRCWATSELWPSLCTWSRTPWTRPRSKMGHGSAWNMCMSVQKDILLCVSTRNSVKSPDRGLVVCVNARPSGLQLWVRRKTWRTWACVKLQCLCVRLRLDDVSTHSGVNSWSSHYHECEQPFVSCLRITTNKKQSR